MGWKAIINLGRRLESGAPEYTEAIGPIRVYVFRGWKEAVCSAAPGPAVLSAFGSVGGLSAYFGGYMTFGGLFSSNEYLGVWGHRNASRFRRILRERLGEIEIVHAKPPKRHAGSSISNSRLTKAERHSNESRIKEGWSDS